MTQSEELIREIQKGLLQWYDFNVGEAANNMEGTSILYIGASVSPLAELLIKQSLEITFASCEQTVDAGWQQVHAKGFDYVIAVEALELQPDPMQFLRTWRTLLKPAGRMLLGMNNRLGIRYFCGDRDPYTERNFDGVEDYRRAYSKKEDIFQGRMYDQAQLRRLLQDAGWPSHRFFSVFSDLQNPTLIYGEDFLPNEDLTNRVFPMYRYPDSVFLEEENLYGSLAENGMFHKMANAYLIECSLNGEHSDVLQVTASMERGREHALLTVIHKSGIVEKRAAFPEGRERLQRLVENGQELAARGISMVKAEMKNDICVMPYVDGEVGQVYLKRLLRTNVEKFLQETDRFRDLILKSSEIAEPDRGDGEGAVLKKGYLDMVPLNSFYKDGTFVFYDQEFRQENYPANAIIVRMIATLYSGSIELQKFLTPEVLYERYGLTKRLDRWRKMEWSFLSKLRNEKELRPYHERHRRNGEVINSNRQRMNWSDSEYQRLFVDIFRKTENRKLILFGSGNFTQKFLALYAGDHPVYAIIDNNADKWGREMEGVPIREPEMLKQLQDGEYKVLICIKNYLSVMKQLNAMGVKEYGIFDAHRDYPRKRRPTGGGCARGFAPEGERTFGGTVVPGNGAPGSAGVSGRDLPSDNAGGPESGNCTENVPLPKKYRTGYIAGVFDLFHIGHLNMFRRAKEQCEYLIVGVVTDEGVRKHKETEPFIPFSERIEMVRSCRYVDEAVEIPLNYGGTRDAWRLYGFDCQFSGSDYVNNPDWLADKEFLEKHGAEMVFFPYTESTSSTRIKALIEKKLL